MSAAQTSPPSNDELEVSLFGPGKGECIVVHVPGGTWFVVDSLRLKPSGEPVAVAYLRALGVSELYGAFITHWHVDHTDGFADLVEAFAPRIQVLGLPPGWGQKELATLAAHWGALNMSPSGYNGRVVRDLNALLSQLSKPSLARVQRVILHARARLEPPGAAWSLTALSPSAAEETDLAQTLLPFLPGYIGPKPPRFDKNSGSVVLSLCHGKERVLLSSDLDIGRSMHHGWKSIHAYHSAHLPSSLVKVGHHGSKTAFHEPSWSAIGTLTKPLAAVTPFPARSAPLPRQKMISRLKTVARELYLTARTRRKTIAPFDDYVAISASSLQNVGHVRFRGGPNEDLRVEVFHPATRL